MVPGYREIGEEHALCATLWEGRFYTFIMGDAQRVNGKQLHQIRIQFGIASEFRIVSMQIIAYLRMLHQQTFADVICNRIYLVDGDKLNLLLRLTVDSLSVVSR